MGPFATDRDAVIKTTYYNLSDNKFLYISKTIKKDEIPEIPDAIRMDMYKATLCWNVDGDLHLTEFTSMNLRGYFPIRLMNMVMSSMT
jgi:hypothetical protein